MKTRLLLLGATALLCFISCKNTKEVAKENDKIQVTETAFDPAEYTAGKIVYSQEKGDCEYTIQLKEGIYYDPINLGDAYKKDGKLVYFKFRGLRMANRCSKATPISIEEMLSK